MRLDERIKCEARIRELQHWRREASKTNDDVTLMTDGECNRIRRTWSQFHSVKPCVNGSR